jgi:hypothetical protein
MKKKSEIIKVAFKGDRFHYSKDKNPLAVHDVELNAANVGNILNDNIVDIYGRVTKQRTQHLLDEKNKIHVSHHAVCDDPNCLTWHETMAVVPLSKIKNVQVVNEILTQRHTDIANHYNKDIKKKQQIIRKLERARYNEQLRIERKVCDVLRG